MWGTGHAWLAAAMLCAGCGMEHVEHHQVDADQSTAHRMRDVDAQPCTLETWASLAPDLRCCALSGASLELVNLRRANLSDATLEDARLGQADLFKALLVNANLRRADLRRVNLTAADLTAADLTGADLRGATLTNALIAGASLTRALTDSSTVCVSGAPGPCW